MGCRAQVVAAYLPVTRLAEPPGSALHSRVRRLAAFSAARLDEEPLFELGMAAELGFITQEQGGVVVSGLGWGRVGVEWGVASPSRFCLPSHSIRWSSWTHTLSHSRSHNIQRHKHTASCRMLCNLGTRTCRHRCWLHPWVRKWWRILQRIC